MLTLDTILKICSRGDSRADVALDRHDNPEHRNYGDSYFSPSSDSRDRSIKVNIEYDSQGNLVQR